MPLCNFCVFLSLFITFWCHKVIVTRYARKPALYSIGLIKSVNNVIPFAIIIHLLFGIYSISNENIFPFDLKNIDIEEFLKNISEKGFIEDFLSKNKNILPYSITSLFIIVILIFEKVIHRLYKLLLSCLSKKNN